MRIRIRNKVITEPIINILYQAKRELTNGKLKDIQKAHDANILISCPCHKDGYEKHASCRVLADETCEELEAGYAYCFSCGYSAPFAQVIGDLFNEDKAFGEEWLVERFGNTFVEQEEFLQEIVLDKPTVKKEYLDEASLIPFDFYHPYMWKRKLSKEVVDRFRVGYDKERDAITFPVYDERHRLVMVTARSVNSKRFWIPKDVDKPVYLLYDILERGVQTVYVCESQINALTARTWGLDAVALFGTGSEKQYNTLKKSGIRNYILLFDGDEAGRKGAMRFKKNMPPDVFITDVRLPAGKDVNDLTYDEVMTLVSLS
jgi:hypothetical protein